MLQSQKLLSDVTVWSKYSKFIPELFRREDWDEICDRSVAMHIKKYPHLRKEIQTVFNDFVRPKKVFPSMRGLQFGGMPIELANNRIFNCAYSAVDSFEVFSEAMFLLLGGSGFGYSVQKHHIEKLPVIKGPAQKKRRFLIGDSIEGWADAVKVLVKAYFFGKSAPDFDFRDIRPKGARLITSGGKAPGPDPLRVCLVEIQKVLNGAIGRRLKPIEAHDIMCYIADAVLSGGIRRAALISLFSSDDLDMLSAKAGDWWELNPQRGRANNSAVLYYDETSYEDFLRVWKYIEMSGSGEPGIYWSNDKEMGANPCVEIGLKNRQFCNLTETVVDGVQTQEELNNRVRAATFLGTLQAGYTDFHYLGDRWKENTEKDALIGVGLTGIGAGTILPLDLTEAANIVLEENERVAELIGINKAARTTCVKPAGSTSCTAGCASGIHEWHDNFYYRRQRVGKTEALYGYMIENFPDLVEDCAFKPHLEAVMSFPQKAPEDALLRPNTGFMETLERVKRFNMEWIRPGHRDGENHHNVSCTIYLRDDEWGIAGTWMWSNRETYHGISVFPYDGGTYVQAPFETITEEEYKKMEAYIMDRNFDLKQIKEEDDNTSHKQIAACAGGNCEVDYTPVSA